MTLRLPPPPCQIHATAVAFAGQALIIVGASGRGKSGFALELMALGADLIADDRCEVIEHAGRIYVNRPPNLPQAIEARGLGLIDTPCVGRHPVSAVLNLDCQTEVRLPEQKFCTIGDYSVTLIENSPLRHFTAAVFHYLKASGAQSGPFNG